jgi:peptidyl-prolyl cis-trans isomerase C
MSKTATVLLWITAVGCLTAGGLQLNLMKRLDSHGVAGSRAPKAFEERLSLASRLQAESLPGDALAEYEDLLRQEGLAEAKKANVAYMAGNIAFDDLKDFERALAFYQKSLFFNDEPDTQVKRRMTARIVECQERMGRTLDASRTLAEATQLDGASDAPEPVGTVVAKIGDREIVMKEIEEAIQSYPEDLQEVFSNPEGKLEFTRSYVAEELLLEKARRMSLDKGPEVLKALDAAERSILVQALIYQEVSDKIDIQPSDLELYYQAHKEEFTSPRRVKAGHLLLADEAAAAYAKGRLDAGENFSALARELSQDEATREEGGELGWVVDREPHVIPGLEDSAEAAEIVLSLEDGEVSSAISTSAGLHLFKILETQPEAEPPFAEVRDEIGAKLSKERAQALQQDLVRTLMVVRQAVIFDDAFGLGAPEEPAQPVEGVEESD